MDTALLYVVSFLAVIIVLFLICREIVNWYWKVNERITLQQETNQLLRVISNQLSNNPKMPNEAPNRERYLQSSNEPVEEKIPLALNKNMDYLCKKWKLTSSTDNSKVEGNSSPFHDISFELKSNNTFVIMPEYSSIKYAYLQSGTWDFDSHIENRLLFQLNHVGVKFAFDVTVEKLTLKNSNYTNTYVPIL
jgi:hypothetical protein